MAARRYSVASLEGMAVDAENTTAKLKGEPPVYRSRDDDDEDDIYEQKREKRRERVMLAARALIDSGADPQIVARMMLQIPGENQIQQPSDKTSVLDLTEALKNLNEVAVSMRPQTDDRMTEIITEMRAEQKELRGLVTKILTDGISGKTERVDPATAAKNQVSATRELLSAVKDFAGELGWRPPGGDSEVKGKSIDEIKENNRHTEEMAKLGIDKEYKTSVANTLSELPELVGEGLGKMIGGGNGDEQVQQDTHIPVHDKSGVDSIKCEKCGTRIFAPPSTDWKSDTLRIACPNCKTEYDLTKDVSSGDVK